MNVNRRLEWLLETLFPSAPDDLMAVADAAGVTAPAYDVDEPIPYTVADRIPFEQTIPEQVTADDEAAIEHRATCRVVVVEQLAAVRANTPAGARDWEQWTSEVGSDD